MRRTLAVLVTTAALLVPASAASAASTSNASCNNGKGGNGAEWNRQGSSGRTSGCAPTPGGMATNATDSAGEPVLEGPGDAGQDTDY